MIPLFFSFFCFHTEVCAFLLLVGRGSFGKRGVLLVQYHVGLVTPALRGLHPSRRRQGCTRINFLGGGLAQVKRF